MCFKRVFFRSCVSVRGIAVKWTGRFANNHGGQSLLRRAMSSMFSKYPSLLFEILKYNLHSGQLHPLPTSNGAEITTLQFVVTHSSQAISNTYRGIIQPFRGIVQPFRGIIQPFRGIIQPLRGSTYPMRRITFTLIYNAEYSMLSAHNAVDSIAITWELLLRRIGSSSRGETNKFSLTKSWPWKTHPQKLCLVNT